ncbi:MAG: sigma-54-dependent Fis family transcriptional regulator, partial [Cyclobacteriaceae bacterium]|nr:sigma-54-dependent Fis family transcriptional regulator [Cyclobacteriaceae bacterium]
MELIDGNILIVDDDPDVLETARLYLKQKFGRVVAISNPDGLDPLLQANEFDAILLDMNFERGELEGEEGIFWLKRIKSISPDTSVIMITAYGDINLAVETMKEGASDFILKPWKNEKLFGTIMAALALKRAKTEYSRLRGAHEKVVNDIDKTFQDIIGVSPVMNRTFELINKVADTDANVLILGENGTGKELVARALHRLSPRNQEVFIRVDLGAITETLFESELFGHVKGAFTDAKTDRAGSFELAKGGTIFLDEIGNLTLPLQAKLLTAIQSREIRRVGSNRIIPLNVRLICATNMPLYEMAEKDKPEFRKDLLYRINTVEIMVPPLRERVEDIPLLARHFLDLYSGKYHKQGIKLEEKLLKKMKSYSWPGNVRELQHTLEKGVILADHGRIPEEILGPDRKRTNREEKNIRTLDDMEKIMIRQSMDKNQGNLSQ